MFSDKVRGAGMAGIEFSHTDSPAVQTDSTTFTFSSAALGAANAGRTIIVSVSATDVTSKTISSVTVGGVSATQRAFLSAALTNEHIVAIYTAEVPTGTTGDVVVTFSGATDGCGVALYRMVNHLSSVPDATDTASATDSTVELTMAPTVGGVTVAVGNGESLTTAISWSVLATTDVDEALGSDRWGAASEFPDDGGTNPVMTHGAALDCAAAIATWV